MEALFGGGILWTLLIGFIVGLLARALKPGNNRLGVVRTIMLGIVGALLARVVGVALHWYGPGESTGFIVSVVGAMVVLALAAAWRRRPPA